MNNTATQIISHSAIVAGYSLLAHEPVAALQSDAALGSRDDS